jgi:hypothetical protein
MFCVGIGRKKTERMKERRRRRIAASWQLKGRSTSRIGWRLAADTLLAGNNLKIYLRIFVRIMQNYERYFEVKRARNEAR